MSGTKTVNPWELDLRVRERNLKKGLITERDIEKHKKDLVDLEGETDGVSFAQPAVGDGEDDVLEN